MTYWLNLTRCHVFTFITQKGVLFTGCLRLSTVLGYGVLSRPSNRSMLLLDAQFCDRAGKRAEEIDFRCCLLEFAFPTCCRPAGAYAPPSPPQTPALISHGTSKINRSTTYNSSLFQTPRSPSHRSITQITLFNTSNLNHSNPLFTVSGCPSHPK